MLEAIVNDESFLADPLKHVALFSDHGIVHGRDIAGRIVQVLQHINGLLIPERQGSRLEFMLGYGVMLAYLHDIGMRDFSAFGRAMHPEFAAQLVYTLEFDPLVELLWQENAGNVAWRLSNLAVDGRLQQPARQVFRELLALSIAHSKSKIPMAVFNDRVQLRTTMQRCLCTDLHYLYHQQQVAKAKQKLADAAQPTDALLQAWEQANANLATWLQSEVQTTNPDLDRYYQSVDRSFQWLVSDDMELQPFVLDVLDTVRTLRCADALRQRGQTFRTSAGYEVFVNQHTANAVYGLQSSDGDKLFLLEGKDPISAGEANITGCDLDRAGHLRVTFDRGAFSSPQAVEWAAYSAAVVINDIQADVIGSFVRPANAADWVPFELREMQILVEGVDDNPNFAAAVCANLRQLNPTIADRCRPVAALQPADLVEIDRYLAGIEPAWSMQEQQAILNQVAKSGQKVDHLEPTQAFREVKLITVHAGEVLIAENSPGSFVYIPMSVGLKLFPLGGYQATPIQAWMQIGNTAAIKGSVRNARVVAEQTTELMMIPKQIYLQFWYNPYTTDEFVQLFGKDGSTLERRHLLMPIAVHKKLISKTRRQRHLPLALHLKTVFKDPSQVTPFITYLEKLDVQAGEVVFRQGDRADALYFVELGQLCRVVPLYGGQTKPVQLHDSGDWVGEIDFYTQAHYQTTAVAECDSRLYRLTRAALQQMQQDHPQAAVVFSELLLSVVAHRVNSSMMD